MYQSPDAPIELMISDLPFSDSVRDFQRFLLLVLVSATEKDQEEVFRKL